MDATTRPLRVLVAAVTGGLVATAGCIAREPPDDLVRVPEGLAIRVRGRGSDVILIHGALGDYRQWEQRLSRACTTSNVRLPRRLCLS